jgi:two-component system, NarL family, nitrate/nitrite response regulator NarL
MTEDGVEELTKREVKIISLVAKGMTNKDVANNLNISVKTIKHHMTHVMQKLQAKNRLEAVIKFRELENSLRPLSFAAPGIE